MHLLCDLPQAPNLSGLSIQQRRGTPGLASSVGPFLLPGVTPPSRPTPHHLHAAFPDCHLPLQSLLSPLLRDESRSRAGGMGVGSQPLAHSLAWREADKLARDEAEAGGSSLHLTAELPAILFPRIGDLCSESMEMVPQ